MALVLDRPARRIRAAPQVITDDLLAPQYLASEVMTELETVMDDLRDIVELLEKEEDVEK